MQIKNHSSSITQPLKLKLHLKRLTILSTEDVEQLEFSYIANEKAKRHSHFGKAWRFLINLNIHLPYDPVIPCLGINPREKKTYIHTKT